MEDSNIFLYIYHQLPDLVKKKFDNLSAKYPMYSGKGKKMLLELPAKIDLNQTVIPNKTGDLAQVNNAYLFEALESFKLDQVNSAENELETCDENFEEFQKDLINAIKAYFLFPPEIEGMPINHDVATRHLIHDLGSKDMLMNDKSEIFQRVEETILHPIRNIQLPEGINAQTFVLTIETMPYDFVDTINKSMFVDLLFEFLLDHRKIDCSRQEFVNHLIHGKNQNKLIWKGKALELSAIHGIMKGNNSDLPSNKILNMSNIHQLCVFHFLQKNGSPVIQRSSNNNLSRGFNKEAHPFLVEFSNFLKKIANQIQS